MFAIAMEMVAESAVAVEYCSGMVSEGKRWHDERRDLEKKNCYFSLKKARILLVRSQRWCCKKKQIKYSANA